VTSLETLLAEARDFGYLGSQPIGRQIEHAAGFADVCAGALSMASAGDGPAVDRLLDLGAGGGLPGLVLATGPSADRFQLVLIDSSKRRTEWLWHAVEALGLDAAVQIVLERAEEAGRSPLHRYQYAAVVARSFGRPGVTAECAAPLLRVGGILIVSEPPAQLDDAADSADGAASAEGARCLGPAPQLAQRWPTAGLAELGLSPAEEWRARGFRYAVVRSEHACTERYPRRNGVPAKRPLF